MDDTTLTFTFAAMELSIQSLSTQLAAVLKLITITLTSAAMGGYRQAVVTMENNELLVAAVGFR